MRSSLTDIPLPLQLLGYLGANLLVFGIVGLLAILIHPYLFVLAILFIITGAVLSVTYNRLLQSHSEASDNE